MSKIQDLRDKIHRIKGEEFKLSDLNSKYKGDYFSLRKLVDFGEITSEGTGRNAIYKATSSLRIRKIAQEEIKKTDLMGWRSVAPFYFKAPSKGQLYSIY